MYIVIEIQTAADGTVGNLVYAFDSLDEARSKYFSILAAASVSVLPCHAACIIKNTGEPVEFRYFSHEVEG